MAPAATRLAAMLGMAGASCRAQVASGMGATREAKVPCCSAALRMRGTEGGSRARRALQEAGVSNGTLGRDGEGQRRRRKLGSRGGSRRGAHAELSMTMEESSFGSEEMAGPLDLIGVEDIGGETLLFRFGLREELEEEEEGGGGEEEGAAQGTAVSSLDEVGDPASHSEGLESEGSAETNGAARQDQEDPSSTDSPSPSSPWPSDQILHANLTLEIGISNVPHPLRASRGGDDAYLVEGTWLGVADGISVWVEQGVNSGLYSRELLWNCVNTIRDADVGPHPKDVIEESHSRTDLRGSCTVTLAVLDGQMVRIANIGDSGFLLLRDGSIILRSESMQHSFNSPFQVGCNVGDEPSCAMEYEVLVLPGDMLILGTDGLFDNVFDADIVAAALEAKEEGKGPELVAKRLTTLAHKQGESTTAVTPFSEEAKAAGEKHEGGKRDDVTVIVAFVEHNEVDGDEE